MRKTSQSRWLINALERAAAASAWARIHPAEKALALLGLLLLAISLPPLPALPLISCVIIGFAYAARVPWRLYLTRIAAPAAFIAVGLGPLIFAITTNGLVLLPNGIENALTVLARCVVAMGAVMLFALTTPMSAQIELMRMARLPDSIVHVVVMMYRMISTLISTARTMWEAQAARLGHSTKRGWLRSVGEEAASLFVISLERARSLEAGLELRADPAAIAVLPDFARPRTSRLIAATSLLVGLTGVSLLIYFQIF